MRLSREELFSRSLLVAVLLVSTIGLWPELSITRYDLNDNISHFTMLDAMVKAVEHGESPIDFWAPEVTFGYPVFRTYQPLAHGMVALIYFGLGKLVPLMTVFMWVRFLSVVLLPLTFFKTARLLGLPPLTCAAAALLSTLISSIGGGLFGLEYRSYLWLGYGLFPQSVATHFLLLSLGYGWQALRRGRHIALTGAMLGLTCLAHFIYGYIGALTLCLLAVLPDPELGRWVRIRRTAWAGAGALALALFQLTPLALDHAIINHSRYEPADKWDSYGAAKILAWLFQGELFDHLRLPVFSLLVAAGVALVLWRFYRSFATSRRLAGVTGEPLELFALSGAVMWLLIYFGRSTWGGLLYLLGVSRDIHLHRVVAGVEIFGILLAAFALAGLWRWLGRRSLAAAAIVSGILLFPAFQERAGLMVDNDNQGRQNLTAVDAELPAVNSAISAVNQRGGRAYAGLVSTWGSAFKIGYIPFFAFFSTRHAPAVSFIYNNLALPSDIMMRFDETNPDHYRLFNIRSVVVPTGPAPPAFLTPRAQAGRFRIFDAPGAGYFDVVDAPAAVSANRETFYDITDRWLHSDWLPNRQHLWLDFFGRVPAAIPRLPDGGPLPPSAVPSQPAGAVLSEHQTGQLYQADVEAARASFALFRMTWHPNWKAYVDNRAVATAMLSPGFLGVPLSPGRHHVLCRYEPEPWRWLLAPAGVLMVLLIGFAEGRKSLPGA